MLPLKPCLPTPAPPRWPAGNWPHEIKHPDGRPLIPGVVSHATNVVEHPQLVADRIGRYARIVGRENVIPGTDCGLGGRIHPQIAWAKLEVTRAGCGFGKQAAMAGLSLSRFVPKRLARGGADWFGLGPLPVWFQMEVPL